MKKRRTVIALWIDRKQKKEEIVCRLMYLILPQMTL